MTYNIQTSSIPDKFNQLFTEVHNPVLPWNASTDTAVPKSERKSKQTNKIVIGNKEQNMFLHQST